MSAAILVAVPTGISAHTALVPPNQLHHIVKKALTESTLYSPCDVPDAAIVSGMQALPAPDLVAGFISSAAPASPLRFSQPASCVRAPPTV